MLEFGHGCKGLRCKRSLHQGSSQSKLYFAFLIDIFLKNNYYAGVKIALIMMKLGGPTLIGRRLNIRPQAVSMWVAKGQIPAARVPALVRFARERGLEFGPEVFRSDLDWAALK